MKPIFAQLLVISLAFTGCSFAAPSTQSVSIIASHQNAEIYVDGQLLGTGPQVVDLYRGRSHVVMAKCGNSAGTASIVRRLSRTAILDIISGAFLIVPLFGLMAPAAFDLSPRSVAVLVPDATACEELIPEVEGLPPGS